MLNKEICEMCIGIEASKPLPGGGLGWMAWNDFDEDRWEKGFVVCRSDERFIHQKPKPKVDEPPPDWCPYVCEHVVSQESKSC